MTRVIHTGDTHIGYQQYHSPERRHDFLDAFETVVADAVDGDVDAVVHAGDLFHDRRPELQDLLGVLSVLRTLSDAGIPFLAIVGNHESTRGGQWLDLFERLGLATRLGSEPVTVGDTAFYGLDHVPESRRDALDYQFEPADAADAIHTALVAHGLFTPFAHGNWDTDTVLSESNVDFDAMLLGDNHVADSAQVEDTWVTYCGSTERASASERDGRGYNIVEFDDDGDVDIRRRGLDTRPFVFVGVELGEGEGAERVREQVRQHDLTDAVVIVDIDGDGDPVAPATIEEFALERGALVARVTDRREFDTEVELSVTFADPDAAVRERIDDMGLSSAAIDVDETVRASKVADSNVREEVKGRVASLVDDLDAFERAPESTDEEEAESDAETQAVSESPTEATETIDDPTESDAESTTETTDETQSATETADDAQSATVGDEAESASADGGSDSLPIGDESDVSPDDEADSPPATDESGSPPVTEIESSTTGQTDANDDQSSMEEYL